MLGIRRATGSAADAAESVKELADDVRSELSDTFAQVRTGVQYAPALVIGVGVVAVVALILSIVAVTRRD